MEEDYKENLPVLFFGLFILGGIYLGISSPRYIAVNERGEVEGLENKIREVLQGKRFWKDQLREVDLSIKDLLAEPERWSGTRSALDEGKRDLGQYAETESINEERRLKRLEKLRNLRPLVQAKTN